MFYYFNCGKWSGACWDFMCPVTVPDEIQALKCPFKPACDITAEMQRSGWMEWIMHRWSAPQQTTSERVTWPSVALESTVVINKGFTKGGKLSGGPGQPGYSEPLSQYFKYFMVRIMSSCSERRHHETDGQTDGQSERGRMREVKKKTTASKFTWEKKNTTSRQRDGRLLPCDWSR